MIINYYNVHPKYKKWLSILLAVFLSLDTIFIYLFPSAEGVDTGGLYGQINIVCLFLFMIVSFRANLLRPRNVPIICWLITIFILVYLIITMSLIGEPRTPFTVILVFSIVSFLLPHFCVVDTRLFLKTIMLLTVPAVFRIDVIFFRTIVTADSMSTGYSFSFLKPVIISIIYMFYYFRDENNVGKIYMGVAFLFNMIIAGFLVMFGTRAVVFSLLLLLFGVYVTKRNKKIGTAYFVKSRLKYAAMVLLIVLFFFIPFLTFLQGTLKGLNVSLYFIDRYLDMYSREDLMSGRDEIFQYTIHGIEANPLLGYGVDQFYNNTGYVYPHNFFLQMYYDCGCIIASLLFIPLVINLVSKIRKNEFDEFALIMALFFASVPGALFSNDLWANSILWIFFGFVFSKKISQSMALKK